MIIISRIGKGHHDIQRKNLYSFLSLPEVLWKNVNTCYY